MSQRRSGLIVPFGGVLPTIAADAFIADNATVIGNVEIGAGASVWFGVVLRGDVGKITIGARTNIQDGSIIHVAGKRHGTQIGADCLIGHAAVMEGCILEDGAFVGMQSVILEGAVIESGAMVAAGALITPGKRVKKGELWGGMPAKMMRAVSAEEAAYIPAAVRGYAELGQTYRRERGA
ncbi:MAG: gamma carbonic anhydrase family protein [Alphaproteobacteria bacterium]|nr:gamma carbonic anhydrase family protein [Alphaproteobacteria bacterium]